MGSNSFGNILKMCTWGESHGPAIGVVMDGVPSGIPFSVEDVNAALERRASGKTPWTSPRGEPDRAELLSGVFEGRTTGAPVSMMIRNETADSRPYEATKQLLKPGHAQYTYQEKYGIFDHRGGGRASARETACRVMGGVLAQKILSDVGVRCHAFLGQVGKERTNVDLSDVDELRKNLQKSQIFCPDPHAEKRFISEMQRVKDEGDSIGGLVTAVAYGVPVGWGDPIYEKLEANLAKAMMSLPASKSFEIGMGRDAVMMQGSQHNDAFIAEEGGVGFASNVAGGILGGISTGMPICLHVGFKPASSIRLAQPTVDQEGEAAEFRLPEHSKHDPCVAIRAVPVVEAMMHLVLADAYLMLTASRGHQHT